MVIPDNGNAKDSSLMPGRDLPSEEAGTYPLKRRPKPFPGRCSRTLHFLTHAQSARTVGILPSEEAGTYPLKRRPKPFTSGISSRSVGHPSCYNAHSEEGGSHGPNPPLRRVSKVLHLRAWARRGGASGSWPSRSPLLRGVSEISS
jgi:hypothetical protein